MLRKVPMPTTKVFGLLEYFHHEMDAPARMNDGVIIRNPTHSEITTITNQLSGWPTVVRLPEIRKDSLLLESSWTLPITEALKDHHEQVDTAGRNFAQQAVSLLRLAHPGPVGMRIVCFPLSERPDCAHTVALVDRLPPFIRSGYPTEENRFYPTAELFDAQTRELFQKFWGKKDLMATPGIRSLNKVYTEDFPADGLADLVFGLEQVLLWKEEETSLLSYKMSLRGAWLVGDSFDERKEVFRILRKAYKIRSLVAHGRSDGYLHPDDLGMSYRVEDILRQCIRLWLSDATQFRSGMLDDRCLGLASE